MLDDKIQKEFLRKMGEGATIADLKPCNAECGIFRFSNAIVAYLKDGSKMIYIPAEEG